MPIEKREERRALAKVKQEVYLLAKEMVDQEDRANSELLYEAYLYLCDYNNFVDKLENTLDKQRRAM